MVEARFKSESDDFCVSEELGFSLSGEGQHEWLQIRKRNLNTGDLVEAIAKRGGFSSKAIGYSGLKDRFAVTTQWLSVDLAGRAAPDWSTVLPAGCDVLHCERHHRKLRRGAHRRNRFEIVLRDLSGDRSVLAARAGELTHAGVPNYFGPQRFGREAGNVQAAALMLSGRRKIRSRHLRGIYLSAARALVFNRVLHFRVADGSWDHALPGDLMMLNGSNSVFPAEIVDLDIERRIAEGDIHPTGPLWGAGSSRLTGAALESELAALRGCEQWCEGLGSAGLKHERRALRVMPLDLTLELRETTAVVKFALPSGAFATSVLREMVKI